MKTSLVLAAIVVAAIAAPVASAAGAYKSLPGGFVKDSPVTLAVKARLNSERVNSFSRLHVATDADGVVWLEGTVDSQAEADRAVAIAKGTDNVKSVNSELVVKPTQK